MALELQDFTVKRDGRTLVADVDLHLAPGSITAVLGATAPHLDAVRAGLASLPCKSELLVGTNRMADLMAQSDLAIGAAGSTSWERCVLGLPTVCVILADNQRSAAEALSGRGAIYLVDFETHKDQ